MAAASVGAVSPGLWSPLAPLLAGLAALIFGRWRPVPTPITCLLFGFAEALQIRLQGVSLWGGKPIPVQFMQILPYVVPILVLAGFVGRSRGPKAAGTVFRRA